jgi:tRNA A37 N6-isopentenylltransferase MiaA
MELTKPRKVPMFDLKKHQEKRREKTTLTLWVDADIKDAYDRIQDLSSNNFSKHLVSLVTAEIESAESQAG